MNAKPDGHAPLAAMLHSQSNYVTWGALRALSDRRLLRAEERAPVKMLLGQADPKLE